MGQNTTQLIKCRHGIFKNYYQNTNSNKHFGLMFNVSFTRKKYTLAIIVTTAYATKMPPCRWPTPCKIQIRIVFLQLKTETYPFKANKMYQ